MRKILLSPRVEYKVTRSSTTIAMISSCALGLIYKMCNYCKNMRLQNDVNNLKVGNMLPQTWNSIQNNYKDDCNTLLHSDSSCEDSLGFVELSINPTNDYYCVG